MKINSKSVLILLLVLFSQVTDAQDCVKKVKDFEQLIERYNVSYTPQKDYSCLTEEALPEDFHPRYGQFAGVNFGLYNKHSDIFIFMMFYLIGKGVEGSNEYVDSMANILAIQKFKLKFADTSFREKAFKVSNTILSEINASRVNVFNVKVDFPYKGKYGYIKAVNFERQDLGGVRLYFIATNNSKDKEVDLAIRETWGIIKYKDNSLYKPGKTMNGKLIGKFRYLNPKLSVKDSTANAQKDRLMQSFILSTEAKNIIEQKDYKKAINNYLQVLALNPLTELNVYQELSDIYLQEKKLDSALYYANILMKIDPTNLDNQKALANYYAGNGEIEKGISILTVNLNKSIELDNMIFFYLSQFYIRNSMYEPAIEKLKVLYQYFSKNNKPTGPILFSLGQSYQGLATLNEPDKNLALAREYYIKAQQVGYRLPKTVLDILSPFN